MSLHPAKRKAIQEWWNCLDITNSSVEYLSQFTDGKLFYDAINSLYLTDEPSTSGLNNQDCNNNSAVLSVDNHNIQVCESPASTQAESCDTTVSEVDKVQPMEIIENGTDDAKIRDVEGVKPAESIEAENIMNDVEKVKHAEESKEANDNTGNIVEAMTAESIKTENMTDDARKLENYRKLERKSRELLEDSKSAKGKKENIKEVKPVEHSEANNEVEAVGDIVDTYTSSINERYKSIKTFIDDKYDIRSENVVSYAACKKSDELELGKVAILLLSYIVKKYIQSNNQVKLNTLTLIDICTQEDIQECLWNVLEEKEITKRNLRQVLTNPAKYRRSPRKSPRCSVPSSISHATPPPRKRGRPPSSAKTPNELSSEVVFSSSPLKMYLESPQMKRWISKDKELLTVQKTLHAEELRSEDLQLELEQMKKKLEAIETESQEKIAKLSEENKMLLSGKNELEDKLKSAAADNSQLNHRLTFQSRLLEDKEMELRKQTDKFESNINSLENKLKVVEEQKRSCDSYVRQSEKLIIQLKQKELECSELMEDIAKLKEDLKQEKENHACTKNLLSEKITEAESLQMPDAPVNGDGDVLGNYIEEENRNIRAVNESLRNKLHECIHVVEMLMKEQGNSDDAIEGVKLKLSNVPRNESNLSGTTLLDTTDLPDSEKENIVLKYSELLQETREAKATTPQDQKRNPQVPDSTDENPVRINTGLGALWAKHDDITLDLDTPSSSNIPMEDILKKLGFHKDEYSAKIEDGKRIIHSLQAYFTTKSTNGHGNLHKEWEKILKCDKDSIMSLYHCRESILKYLNSDSNDYLVTLKSPLRCVMYEKIPLLKKEIDDLKTQERALISEIEEKNSLIVQKEKLIKEKSALLEIKDALVQEKDVLLKEKDTLIAEKNANGEKQSRRLLDMEYNCKKLYKYRVQLLQERKDLCKMVEDLKAELKEMKDECIAQQKSFNEFFSEKNFAEYTLKKNLANVSEKLKVSELKQRENEQRLEREREININAQRQLQLAVSKIDELRIQRANLQSDFKNVSLKLEIMEEENKNISNSNKSLESEVERLTDVIQELKNGLEAANAEKLATKNTVNINLAVNQHGTTESESNNTSKPSTSRLRHSEVSRRSVFDASMLNDMFYFGKLLEGNVDEDHYSFISGIESSMLETEQPDGEHNRVQELKRRNTLYLPHMQSSYPVESQTMNDSTANELRELSRRNDSRASTLPNARLKKRKLADAGLESEARSRQIDQPGPSRIGEAGPSGIGRAGPSRIGEAGPSRIGRAGPSRIGEAGPSRIGRAGPSQEKEEKPPKVLIGAHKIIEASTPRVQKRRFKTPSSLTKLMNFRRGRRPNLNKP